MIRDDLAYDDRWERAEHDEEDDSHIDAQLKWDKEDAAASEAGKQDNQEA